MNKTIAKRGFPTAAAVGVLALTFLAGTALPLRAEDKPSEKGADSDKLAKDLIGTWVLVGTPDNVKDAPKAGGRLKFFTGSHWCITQADPDTGKVIFHHGGVYTLDGADYAETIEYANDNTADLIQKTLKFKIKVDGDTYTQVGVGNPYTEVWKRLK